MAEHQGVIKTGETNSGKKTFVVVVGSKEYEIPKAFKKALLNTVRDGMKAVIDVKDNGQVQDVKLVGEAQAQQRQTSEQPQQNGTQQSTPVHQNGIVLLNDDEGRPVAVSDQTKKRFFFEKDLEPEIPVHLKHREWIKFLVSPETGRVVEVIPSGKVKPVDNRDAVAKKPNVNPERLGYVVQKADGSDPVLIDDELQIKLFFCADLLEKIRGKVRNNAYVLYKINIDTREIVSLRTTGRSLGEADNKNQGAGALTPPGISDPSRRARAPYNFVFLNEAVKPAEPLPERDRFHSGRYTGSIELEIETETPLFIWGGEESGSRFFSPGGKTVIPGSSLRGMTRQLFEIMTESNFKQFADRRLFFRDFASVCKSITAYYNRFTSVDTGMKDSKGNPIRDYIANAGYLVREGNRFVIVPAQEEDGKQFEAFHNHIDCCPKSFKKIKEGCVVVTGSKVGKDRSPNKWLIYNPDNNADKIILTEREITEYLSDNPDSASSERPNLVEQARRGKQVPVFYIKDDREMISFGHTVLFRLAYKYSMGDLVRQKRCEGRDMTEAVFGTVDEGLETVSRVSFEDGVPQGQLKFEDEAYLATLLGPKPTTFQHYLEQPNPENKNTLKHYGDPDARLRGHKMYWHKDDQIEWKLSGPASEALNKKVRPVSKGNLFKSRIRFENLSGAELGALLAALQLPDGCAHKIGMGKPVGLGSIRITPKLHLSDRSKRYSDLFAEWSSRPETVPVEPYLEQFYSYITGKQGVNSTRFWRSERMKELQKMMTVRHKIRPDELKYQQIELRQNGERINEYRDRPVLPRPTDVGKGWQRRGRGGNNYNRRR